MKFALAIIIILMAAGAGLALWMSGETATAPTKTFERTLPDDRFEK